MPDLVPPRDLTTAVRRAPAYDNAFDDLVRGKRALLVASSGGHISQLVRLRPSLGLTEGTTWVTFDTPQTRSLLAGEDVEWVPYIAPRDLRGAVGALRPARRLLRDLEPEVVLSTGSAVAVPYLLSAASRRVPAVYLESVSRVDGYSLTGRMMAESPRVHTFTQHHHLSSPRWRRGPQVLATYTATQGPAAGLPAAPKVYVTLGTIRPYRFDRLVDRVLELARPDWQITWQLGATSRDDLPGAVHDEVPADEVDRLIRESDVVITHSGVGSVIRMLELGRAPVVVPRSPRHAEHVDAHQEQIARFVDVRGLGVRAYADQLDLADLERAHRTVVSAA